MARLLVKALAGALMLCCGGCAQSLTITAANLGPDVHFAFAPQRFIGDIEVFEKDAPPGRPAICRVRWHREGAPADREPRFTGWAYGRPLDAELGPSSSCPALLPGQAYTIRVSHSGHCMTTMSFQVYAGGTVRELQPSDNMCWM